MDAERLSQFRNAVMNLSASSTDAEWQRARELFDALYAARFVKNDADRAIEFPYGDIRGGFADAMADFNNVVIKRGGSDE